MELLFLRTLQFEVMNFISYGLHHIHTYISGHSKMLERITVQFLVV